MPQFRADLSLGNILTILTMIVGVTLGYQQIASALDHQSIRLTKAEDVIVRLTSAQTSGDKLRADDRLEVTRVLVELQTEMRSIRRELESLNRTRAPSPTR